MIGRSISTIAFDTDLVIKNIHNHSTLYIYMIREMEHSFFTETILDCSMSKILNSILYIIVRHMQMLEIYQQTYNKI